jgi:diguanylate cyclase (GGDEF)-like protein
LIGDDQVAVYGIYRDISARKAAEAALARSHAKVEQLHDAADALGAAESEEEIYQITCDAAERVLGFSLGVLCIAEGDEFICQAVSSTLEMTDLGRSPVNPEGIAVQALDTGHPVIVNDPAPELLPMGIPRTARALICAPIGDIGIFQAASLVPDAFSEEDGRLLAILLGHTSVGIGRLRLQQELIRQARHDALTGVFNRHYFNELIAQEVLRSSRYNHPIGLLMIDVDRFKEINDRYGHQTGDMVLQEIASVLTETVRKSDMIVRYGGDEFLVVLTETGQDAEEAASRVRLAVRASEKLRQISGFDVTVSVGSIFWKPGDGTPIEEALATADSRMYDDKNAR